MNVYNFDKFIDNNFINEVFIMPQKKDYTGEILAASSIIAGGAYLGGYLNQNAKKKVVREIIDLKYGNIPYDEYQMRSDYYVKEYSLKELKQMRFELQNKKRNKRNKRR